MLVAGCATPVGDVADEAAALTGPSFRLEGRVSVRYGDEALSGRIFWVHADERDEVDLASPLGNRLSRVQRDRDGVTLTDSQGRVARAMDAESLTEARLGWRLPLAGLAQWVRGQAAAPGAALMRDDAGRAARLSEAGWDIEFAYGSEAGRLPRRLILNFTRGEKPLEIRLVVDTWAP